MPYYEYILKNFGGLFLSQQSLAAGPLAGTG
jgi:hypothetical protein